MKKNKLEKYYGNDRASKVVYGSVLIFAFLAGQSHSGHDSALPLVFGTFLAAVAIVLAEVYSEILGRTIRNKRKLKKLERQEVEQDSLAIISVSFWPSLIFLLSYFGLFSVHTAFNISYGLLLTVLFVFSYWASILSGRNRSISLFRAAIATCVGLVVILAKYGLGH